MSSTIVVSKSYFSQNDEEILTAIFRKVLIRDDRLVGVQSGMSLLVAYARYGETNGFPGAKQDVFAVFGDGQRYGVLTPAQQELAFSQVLSSILILGIHRIDYNQALKTFSEQFPNSGFLPLLSRDVPAEVAGSIRRSYVSSSPNTFSDDRALVIWYQPGEMKIDTMAVIPDLESLFQTYGMDKTRFVDFWATWCVPCIQEFRHTRNLKGFFESENIISLYISSDSWEARKNWKNMIVQNALFGIHILSGKSLNKDTKENHGIVGIPRYMIVNHMGQIIQLLR